MSIRVRSLLLIVLALTLLAFASACGGGGGAAQPTAAKPAGGAEQPAAKAPAGDAAAGKTSFASAGCTGCHKIAGNAEAVGTVGPELSHVASDAEKIIADPNYKGKAKSADAYIRESIVDPNVHIVSNCPTGPCQPNVMPTNYKDTLKEQQVNDLVAYLLSLK